MFLSQGEAPSSFSFWKGDGKTNDSPNIFMNVILILNYGIVLHVADET